MIFKLGANHKRAVSTALTMLDEPLVSIEKWVDGNQCQSCCTNRNRVAAFRENIMELVAKHLKRYGALSSETAEYMDNLFEKLLLQLDGILETIRAGKHKNLIITISFCAARKVFADLKIIKLAKIFSKVKYLR
ncbi:MAG TPA: hypothetical protein PKW86_08185 [bacterium]|nr:hypothetical protein [bacterium]HOL35834.1 hypothetical protein [bacterium]